MNLTVREASCHVLLGGTGNGKTLLLESIAGLHPLQHGTIKVDDRLISHLPPEQRMISYVPQDLALFPHLNVEDNIFYSRKVRKNRNNVCHDIFDILDCLQLRAILHRSIDNLSGGEQQRVALARAFASGNQVLLLDEPFSALHYALKRSLWESLSTLKARYSMTILMVTHDLDEAFTMADDISVISQGRILQTGSKQEIIDHPSSVEVANMTGYYNFLKGIVTHIYNGVCTIRLKDIEPELSFPSSSIQEGSSVTAAIRTSAILFESSEYEPCISFDCRIHSITQSLHYQKIIAVPTNSSELSGTQITIDHGSVTQGFLKQNDDVRIWIPTSAILIFPE